MRRRLFALLVVAAAFPACARAAPVVVLGPGTRVSTHDDRFLTGPAMTPSPALVRTLSPRALATARTVEGELRRLRRAHAISIPAYRRYGTSWSAALAVTAKLRGTRAVELRAVIENVQLIAAAGMLTPSRLPALFLTLDRNRRWWTRGRLLRSGQRVEFAGSGIVWEYYPGQGIELQVLGSFGKADGLYTAGPARYQHLRQLLGELIPLAAHRGGGLTWEYYFRFDDGSPPWTSAMSQGTALEALTRGYEAFHDPSYLQVARRALPIFGVPPPTGVAVRARHGTRYLEYSFGPRARIINAFLQALIGLYDFARTGASRRAARLFVAGDTEARAELPSYDTGAWSLYEPGVEDTLKYHILVTGFLSELCARTRAAAYCPAARRFQGYLHTPPSLRLLTLHASRGAPFTIRFRLSKHAHVGIVVARGGRGVFRTSASFGYGVHGFAIPPLGAGDVYTIRLSATDLAGNFHRIVGTLHVS